MKFYFEVVRSSSSVFFRYVLNAVDICFIYFFTQSFSPDFNTYELILCTQCLTALRVTLQNCSTNTKYRKSIIMLKISKPKTLFT